MGYSASRHAGPIDSCHPPGIEQLQSDNAREAERGGLELVTAATQRLWCACHAQCTRSGNA